LSEENVRASEVRGPMVGNFLPQTRGSSLCVKATGDATYRASHAKYAERGEYEDGRGGSYKQLTEVVLSEDIF
jgi:hypothetical protein